MRNKFGTLFMILGTALIIGALILFTYNRNEARAARAQSEALLPKLVERMERMEEWEDDPEADLPVPSIPEELLTEEDVKMEEVEIDKHRYIGYLSIPSLDLELPIMSDWSYPQLKIAPCRYYGTVRGNDLVLLAHNYDRHFGRIKNLNEGDLVFFTDVAGNVTGYSVVAQDVLSPNSVEEMTAGVFDLTLFTCTYGGKSRVTVYCNRISKQ